MKLLGIDFIWRKIFKSKKEPFVLSQLESKANITIITTGCLQSNVEMFSHTFEHCSDLSIKYFNLGSDKSLRAAILYIDTLVDNKIISASILEPLMLKITAETADIKESVLEFLENSSITVAGVEHSDNIKELISGILSGRVILFFDKFSDGLIINCKMFKERSIIEPLMESVNRGPRDGFTENINTNIALVRQRLKDPSLKIRKIIIGERTKTEVAMLYIEDIANSDTIESVYAHLSKISTDGVLESGYIEEYLETTRYSLFPQVENTERPDKVVGNILEGRISIFVDGSPFASIVPAFFMQFFQSPEDYYQRTVYSMALRLFRFISAFIATSLPAIYLSLVSYHSQLIPSKLIDLLLNGRSQLPFPATLEVLLMLFLVDLIQEASSRLLGRVGQAAGIVGSIILGQAAIAANIAAPTTVVIIATTLLSSYVLPSYVMEFAFRLIRYLIIFAASFLGIYGIAISWLLIIIHLCDMESINTPYLSPIAPLKVSDLKDSFIRLPLLNMFKRPQVLEPRDNVRIKKAGGEGDGKKKK